MTVLTEDLDVQYPGPPPVEAIRRLSIRIETGEFVTIVGPSGSGKTSLLHAIGTLLEPTAGRIVLDDRDVSAIGEKERNCLRSTEIGFVFQEPRLIEHRSVIENTALGSLYRGDTIAQRRQRAEEVLEWVAIERLGDQKARNLSGGEKQRVGIARALMTQPKLLLCDEPTGNLDSSTSSLVISLLNRLRADHHLTVLVVTHDHAVRRASDRSITIRDGQLAP